MAETFYGTWLIDVVGKNAAFNERYVVSGSDRADGVYAADIGSPRLQVSGARWTLEFEWNDNLSSGWQQSRVIRRQVDFNVDDGLVVQLGIDDNWIHVADNDFNDVLIRCQNIDPELIPWHPHRRSVDFRLPKRGKDNQPYCHCGRNNRQNVENGHHFSFGTGNGEGDVER